MLLVRVTSVSRVVSVFAVALTAVVVAPGGFAVADPPVPRFETTAAQRVDVREGLVKLPVGTGLEVAMGYTCRAGTRAVIDVEATQDTGGQLVRGAQFGLAAVCDGVRHTLDAVLRPYASDQLWEPGNVTVDTRMTDTVEKSTVAHGVKAHVVS
jgi:hypothetical protein